MITARTTPHRRRLSHLYSRPRANPPTSYPPQPTPQLPRHTPNPTLFTAQTTTSAAGDARVTTVHLNRLRRKTPPSNSPSRAHVTLPGMTPSSPPPPRHLRPTFRVRRPFRSRPDPRLHYRMTHSQNTLSLSNVTTHVEAARGSSTASLTLRPNTFDITGPPL
jgi:hypothetical protein